jgi:hypothetical protein
VGYRGYFKEAASLLQGLEKHWQILKGDIPVWLVLEFLAYLNRKLVVFAECLLHQLTSKKKKKTHANLKSSNYLLSAKYY